MPPGLKAILLSMLATKRGEVVDMINKLVREFHSSRHVSVKVQQLECEPSRLVFVGWLSQTGLTSSRPAVISSVS